jgi:hypothetical protein
LPYGQEQLLAVQLYGGVRTYNVASGRFGRFAVRDRGLLTGGDIVAAAVLREGGLALGGSKNGLALVNAHGQTTFRARLVNGLQDEDVNAVFQDVDGDVWLALNSGVTLIDLGQGRQVVADDTVLSAVDSLKSVPFSVVIRKCEGVFDDSLIFNGAFYKVIDGVQQLHQTELQYGEFPFDYNAFRFTYASNAYEELDKIEYFVYMEGLELDQKRGAWSMRTYREYTNLRWGKYTLHISARTPDGRLSREATYAFQIIPLWHETWLFVVAQVCFVFVLLVISALHGRSREKSWLADSLVFVAVMIPLRYVTGLLMPFIGFYSSGIAFFRVFMIVLMGLILRPAENFIHAMIRKITLKIDEEKSVDQKRGNDESE